MSASQIELSTLFENNFKNSFIPPNPEVELSNINESVVEEGGTPLPRFVSTWARAFYASTWTSTDLVKNTKQKSSLPATEEDRMISGKSLEEIEGQIYVISRGSDYHYGTTITMKTQIVETLAPDEIQVAWTPDYLTYNCIRATYAVGDEEIDSLNSHWIKDYFSWNLDNSLKPNYDRDVGNLPELTEWSNFLPERELTIDLPFWFSWSYKLATPLFLLDKRTEVSHSCTFFQNPVKSALRFRVKSGNTWVEVPYDDMSTAPLINYTKPNKPILKTQMGSIHIHEQNHPKNTRSSIPFPAHLIQTTVDEDVLSGNGNKDLDINSDIPVAAISVKALNLKALSRNYHGNYTDNPSDHLRGNCPIHTLSLRYGSVTKLTVTPNELKSVAMRKHFRGLPLTNGYNLIPLAVRPFDPEHCIGVIPPPSTKLAVYLKEHRERKIPQNSKDAMRLLRRQVLAENNQNSYSEDEEYGSSSIPSSPRISNDLSHHNINGMEESGPNSQYRIVLTLLCSTWLTYRSEGKGKYRVKFSHQKERDLE